ncbi:hypothetical protein [Pontivivens ytuae]|uniref:Uncharacterized protein n=1 Tax=Pontivivens ytuae TaxID=2789856 RepID=A0A7S9QCS9_9RHOB|nr:hypothetical protein [Pontivivens ytuae]QPH53677.1 hypothetical protein I0K15_18145 [Pontivivens ytuae]
MMRLPVCACAAAVLATATPALAQDAPDLILHDARIITMDLDRPRAEAMAIADGAIIAVGSDAEILALAGTETDLLDLDGATALPGLIDNHTHAIRGAGGDPNSFRALAATLNASGVTTIVDAGGFNFDRGMRSAATRLDDAGDLAVRVLFLEWLPGTTPDAARSNAERLPSLDTSPDGFTQIIGVGETLYRPLHDRPERPIRVLPP